MTPLYGGGQLHNGTGSRKACPPVTPMQTPPFIHGGLHLAGGMERLIQVTVSLYANCNIVEQLWEYQGDNYKATQKSMNIQMNII